MVVLGPFPGLLTWHYPYPWGILKQGSTSISGALQGALHGNMSIPGVLHGNTSIPPIPGGIT